MTAIEMNNISKQYGKSRAVENFNLSIDKAQICGLIGPNGAGKTTIMKIIAGIMFQSGGELRLFESDKLDEQRNRMSFMIEAPIIDNGLIAYDNLAYIRYLRGYPSVKRIDEVLDIVGLTNAGKKKARNFSLGMKQRLGIGMALLAKPEVLVLDEPVNGLDPEGIVEVRYLLKRLAEEQDVTILISSHFLSELSELCTDYAIINHGRLIESFTSEELAAKCRSRICLKTTDINQTAALLEDKLSLINFKVMNGEEIHIFEQLDRIEAISKAVYDSGILITKLCTEGQNLEEYYLGKVGDSNE
ncbi:MAG: ATP-binding cassette domain-containing protein [Oscillospiraceae bacterium]|nr:ATP-binding cassette domain-containing protein [Oscillospiraceae bacterium]